MTSGWIDSGSPTKKCSSAFAKTAISSSSSSSSGPLSKAAHLQNDTSRFAAVAVAGTLLDDVVGRSTSIGYSGRQHQINLSTGLSPLPPSLFLLLSHACPPRARALVAARPPHERRSRRTVAPTSNKLPRRATDAVVNDLSRR